MTYISLGDNNKKSVLYSETYIYIYIYIIYKPIVDFSYGVLRTAMYIDVAATVIALRLKKII